jgi:hypothetical protein
MNLTSNLRYRIVATGDNYHWIDRTTNEPVDYENGNAAQFPSLDEAIAAFIDGKLVVKVNEPLEREQ